MTIRLALAVYFLLWLAWLLSGYVRQYRGRHRGAGGAGGEEGRAAPQQRRWLYLLIWATLVVAIAAAWHVMHPGE